MNKVSANIGQKYCTKLERRGSFRVSNASSFGGSFFLSAMMSEILIMQVWMQKRLKEDEKDKWDKLQDKYYVATELIAECKAMMRARKARKVREKAQAKNMTQIAGHPSKA